ncbi:hypothetical protein SAMN06297144_1415 [Sphingomonas guangdongensis]|uniref:Glycosyltransferase RgtA/B/C/D-like domain-containing protein n=1 Tax=Sphingomonas guangdongensis TaxID=1141890 RepID=A0A285QH17_9SPHN|nr:hypothetical protein [Sphingomonas guangdongensis]SOB81136.1 hypothetical protein SAMN06297144_1415 [Sphingomonas guangdongensis]
MTLVFRHGAPLGSIVLTIFGAVAFLTPALINGFPFIFPDSVDYVLLTPRLYRSPFYQLFFYLTGMKYSIWMPVISQALIAGWVLGVFLTVEARLSLIGSFAAVTLLCLSSSLPVFASFVMPDVFTGVMFVALYLLIIRWADLLRWQRAAMGLAVLVAITVHLSHLTMALITVAASFLLLYIRGEHRAAIAGLTTALMACVASASAFLFYNLTVFGIFSVSPAGSTFFLANLLATGPAREELGQICPNEEFRLCGYRNSLPRDANAILWENGVVNELGGFAAMRDESNRLVGDTLRHRPGQVIAFATRQTIHAVAAINSADDIVPHKPSVGGVIAEVYGESTRRQFAQSLQMHDAFPRGTFNLLVLIGLTLAVPTVAFGLIPLGWRSSTFPVFALGAFLCNAAVCATLSGVHDRYQSRLSWLLPLAALTILSEWSRYRIKRLAGRSTYDVTSHR